MTSATVTSQPHAEPCGTPARSSTESRIGTELEATFGTGGVGRALWFGTLGLEAPSKALLVRAVARIGAGADGVAYGAQLALLGRAGKLLAGVNFNATWTGDPSVTVLGLDLRIGTWF